MASVARDQLAGDCGFGHALFADVGFAFHADGDATPCDDGDLDPELVSRRDRTAEASALDAGKDHQLFVAVFDFGEQQGTAGLREDAGRVDYGKVLPQELWALRSCNGKLASR